jgi:hypothetical protein
MTKDEALNLAQKELIFYRDFANCQDWRDESQVVITVIKEILSQPEQEPVCDKDPQGCWNVRCQLGKKCKNTPPQRPWVGLTDEEIQSCWDGDLSPYQMQCIREIEAKLKEKNNG